MPQSDAGPGMPCQLRNGFEEHRNQTSYQGLRRSTGFMTWVLVEVQSLGYVCSDERALAGVKIGVEMRRSYDRHHAGM